MSGRAQPTPLRLLAPQCISPCGRTAPCAFTFSLPVQAPGGGSKLQSPPWPLRARCLGCSAVYPRPVRPTAPLRDRPNGEIISGRERASVRRYSSPSVPPSVFSPPPFPPATHAHALSDNTRLNLCRQPHQPIHNLEPLHAWQLLWPQRDEQSRPGKPPAEDTTPLAPLRMAC